MVSPKKALTFTTYYHMVFFVALSFFTDKLAGQYKVGEAAEVSAFAVQRATHCQRISVRWGP